MKRIIGLIMVVMMALTAVSCYSNHHHSGKKMPPGQAKKIYGKKSAKQFAPGQQKKKGKKSRHYDDVRGRW